MKKFFGVLMMLVVIGSVVFLTGCASMCSGTHQNVALNSVPQGASVKIDGQMRGFTPMTIDLKRGYKKHSLVLELEGYEPAQLKTKKSFNWVSLWNIFNYGVGFVPDLMNGSVCEIEPVETILLEKAK